MRKGQVEVIQKARADSSWLEFHAADGTGRGSVLIPARMEDGIRMHLVDDHKARKAAKKEERRFRIAQCPRVDGLPDVWRVVDYDADEEVHGEFTNPDCAKADARAFAKLLNKRNRKPMGANDGD